MVIVELRERVKTLVPKCYPLGFLPLVLKKNSPDFFISMVSFLFFFISFYFGIVFFFF